MAEWSGRCHEKGQCSRWSSTQGTLQGEWPVVEKFSSHCWTWMTANLKLATLRAAERMSVSVPGRDPTVCQTVYTAYPEWKSSSLARDLLPCSCWLSCWVAAPKMPSTQWLLLLPSSATQGFNSQVQCWHHHLLARRPRHITALSPSSSICKWWEMILGQLGFKC